MGACVSHCNYYVYLLLKTDAMRYKFVAIKYLRMLLTCLSTIFSTYLWISIPSACIKKYILPESAFSISDRHPPSIWVFFVAILYLEDFIV